MKKQEWFVNRKGNIFLKAVKSFNKFYEFVSFF